VGLALNVVVSLLALQPATAAPPAPALQTIIWFRSSDAPTIDARALLDAVAVYTRDLGLAVRTDAENRPVPADAAAARDAAAVLRAQSARLGFWCEMRPGADVAVLTVVATDGHLELHMVERTGAHEAEQYRAIALKLRSVLVGTATPEPAVVVAPPPVVPPPAIAAPPGPDLAVRAQPPAPATPPQRLFVTVGYRLSTSLEAASPRHAFAVDGALALGRLFELDVGTELAARREQSGQTMSNGATFFDTISLFDWPIMAGARIVKRGPRVTVGAGPFAALHLLWASASGSDRAVQSAFTTSGGAGAELLARMRLAGALAGELRLYGEVPLPTTGYILRGTGAEVLNLGARAGVGVGLTFPAP
jgi:hypothetical protein